MVELKKLYIHIHDNGRYNHDIINYNELHTVSKTLVAQFQNIILMQDDPARNSIGFRSGIAKLSLIIKRRTIHVL